MYLILDNLYYRKQSSQEIHINTTQPMEHKDLFPFFFFFFTRYCKILITSLLPD